MLPLFGLVRWEDFTMIFYGISWKCVKLPKQAARTCTRNLPQTCCYPVTSSPLLLLDPCISRNFGRGMTWMCVEVPLEQDAFWVDFVFNFFGRDCYLHSDFLLCVRVCVSSSPTAAWYPHDILRQAAQGLMGQSMAAIPSCCAMMRQPISASAKEEVTFRRVREVLGRSQKVSPCAAFFFSCGTEAMILWQNYSETLHYTSSYPVHKCLWWAPSGGNVVTPCATGRWAANYGRLQKMNRTGSCQSLYYKASGCHEKVRLQHHESGFQGWYHVIPHLWR